MTALVLPDPIAAYFAAKGPEAVARCFTSQGVVKDKGQTHTGHDAIEAWMAEVETLYTCTTAPFLIERNEALSTVHSHVSGNFPGSPIDLKFLFRLERDLIASLEITL